MTKFDLVIIWTNFDGPNATCQGPRLLALWFQRRFLKGFHHTWAWQPSWSCDPDAPNKLLFPRPMKAPHEIWLRLAQWFWRRRSLKIVDGRKDDGACLYYKLTSESKGSGELKITQKNAFSEASFSTLGDAFFQRGVWTCIEFETYFCTKAVRTMAFSVSVTSCSSWHSIQVALGAKRLVTGVFLGPTAIGNVLLSISLEHKILDINIKQLVTNNGNLTEPFLLKVMYCYSLKSNMHHSRQ